MNRSRAAIMALACTAWLFPISSEATADLIGPTPYLSFADSPFHGGIFSYFHLEDFEDGLLNTPGVTASAGAPFGPSGITDSVDGDDGVIDGFGTQGHSFFSPSGSIGITFQFDAVALGSLPTHAGIVWTDGTGSILFEAFDQNGVSLGSLVGNHADNSVFGTTAEDRFYGVINLGGISAIRISNASGGIEVDHLQYGFSVIPEPASLTLCMMGASLFGFHYRWRRTRQLKHA